MHGRYIIKLTLILALLFVPSALRAQGEVSAGRYSASGPNTEKGQALQGILIGFVVPFVCDAADEAAMSAWQAIPRAQKWAPEAVWNPSQAVFQEMLQGCRGDGAKCLELFMPKAGASPQAIAFAKSLGFEAFLSEHQHMGVVDLATITYPFRDNTNDVPALIAGFPLVIDVLDTGGQVDLTHDAAYLSLVKSFPNAGLEGAIPTFLRMEQSPEGGQRFIFIFPIQNGCRACETVAAASVGFDFNSAGVFSGVKLLEVKKTQSTSQAPVPAGTTSPNRTASERIQADSPEKATTLLYSALKACDRTAALKVASPRSVAKLLGKRCEPWKAEWSEFEWDCGGSCYPEKSGYLCGCYYEGGAVNMHVARRPSGHYYVVAVDFVAD